jgi:Cu(I)/Ag(I) efflux system membrane fusion protein
MKRSLVVLLLVVAFVGITATTAWFVMRGGDGHEHAPAAAPSAKVVYHCPMHPQITQDGPGSCPICGMDLVPVSAERMGTEDETADRAEVRIPSAKLAGIGARSEEVVSAPFVREVRAAASVAADETRLRTVTTKIDGYVEKLWADAVGAVVVKGQPLLEIYSPELLAAQQEYLVALRAKDRLATSPLPAVSGTGADLLDSARRRLELLDLTPAQIDALVATGKASRTVVVAAPIGGTILKRDVVQGMRVSREMALLELSDLSRVWVLASVFEHELPFVKEGQRARMSLAYLPGRVFEGKVEKVYPTLDATTRAAQVRVAFPNADGALKPGMFAEVVLEADLGERLRVPTDAVVDTGTRKVVFVEREPGLFEPRTITTGLELPDAVEVVSGLEAGEKVLAAGTFFVDSESKLRAALQATAHHP